MLGIAPLSPLFYTFYVSHINARESFFIIKFNLK